jgi:hypothetical protein
MNDVRSGRLALYLLVAVITALTAVALSTGVVVMASSVRADDHAQVETGRISVDELMLMLLKKKPVTVVRALDTYEEKIAGALQIPLDDLEKHLKELPRGKEIVTYCA